jgi:hypothetical protein
MNCCFQMTKWVINGKNCTKMNIIEEMPPPCIPGMVLIYAPHTIIICKAISIRKWRKCDRDYIHGFLMPIIFLLYRGHKALINMYVITRCIESNWPWAGIDWLMYYRLTCSEQYFNYIQTRMSSIIYKKCIEMKEEGYVNELWLPMEIYGELAKI